MTERSYTTAELRLELERFETVLREADLAKNTVRTYVDRSEIFIRFLEGSYAPRGPIS